MVGFWQASESSSAGLARHGAPVRRFLQRLPAAIQPAHLPLRAGRGPSDGHGGGGYWSCDE